MPSAPSRGGYSTENFEGDIYLVALDAEGNGIYAGTLESTSGFGGTADVIVNIDCDTNTVNWKYFPDAA